MGDTSSDDFATRWLRSHPIVVAPMLHVEINPDDYNFKVTQADSDKDNEEPPVISRSRQAQVFQTISKNSPTSPVGISYTDGIQWQPLSWLQITAAAILQANYNQTDYNNPNSPLFFSSQYGGQLSLDILKNRLGKWDLINLGLGAAVQVTGNPLDSKNWKNSLRQDSWSVSNTFTYNPSDKYGFFFQPTYNGVLNGGGSGVQVLGGLVFSL